MRHTKLKSLLFACSLLTTPAEAAITLAHATDKNVTSGNTATSASFSANVGDIIHVQGGMRFGSSGDILQLTDSVDGAFTAGNVIECRIAAGANGSFSGWIKVATGGSRTITIKEGTGSTSSSGLIGSIDVLTGVDGTTPEDTSGRGTCASNNGSAANPIGTSGSVTHTNELVFGEYISPTVSGFSPTGDPAFTYPSGECSASSVLAWCGGYLIKAATGTQTMQLTVTSRLYSYIFQTFNAAGGITVSKSLLITSVP